MIELQKAGKPYGTFSVCSSNPFVLRAAMQEAQERGALLVVESTANQVNQFGGYMGQTPEDFKRIIRNLQAEYGLEADQVALGGDHLGPTVWQNEPEAGAMGKSARLVADCVRAGYTKIHLDASMKLAGDPAGGPAEETVARRAASLCREAEAAWRDLPQGSAAPVYVIGTEVPPPGGETGSLEGIAVTPVTRAQATLEITRRAFVDAGLEAAWERVIALVVQPGVDFGNTTVHPYRRREAEALSSFIEGVPGMVFEAHSTDYQSGAALRELVEDHFAILKVGPGLTFALREALFALEWIEEELEIGGRSHLQATVEAAMLDQPKDWQKYYPGNEEEQRFLRRYSLSDRVRYYWTQPKVEDAVEKLIANLEGGVIPPALVSQYLPVQYAHYREAGLALTPRALIEDKIREVLDIYRAACEP